MKRFIVEVLEKSSIVLLFLVLLVGLIAGYATGGFLGAIVGLIAAAVIGVMTFGVLFVLLEMNESLRAIRQQGEGGRKL
jgi:membrane associated rhomboid family serine protease